MAQSIADQFDGKVATAPIKSRERALEKIVNDYRGDAFRIKDLARNTIIVPATQIDVVASALAHNGAAVKRINAATDPMGYSGVNSSLKTKNGITGEIQVNSPEMIYAKETPKNARAILGNDVYDSISAKTGIEGGLGHKLYEQWRALPDGNPSRLPIEAQSKAYYDAIRSKAGISATNSVDNFVGPLIGKSGFRTSDEFAYASFTRYQNYVNDAYDNALVANSQGLLRGNPNTRIGDFVDRESATRYRQWLSYEGFDEGAGRMVQMNRWLRDPSRSGLYTRPDIRIPSSRNILDATVGWKWSQDTQITRFNTFSNGDKITIVRPQQLGGSYSIFPRGDM